MKVDIQVDGARVVTKFPERGSKPGPACDSSNKRIMISRLKRGQGIVFDPRKQSEGSIRILYRNLKSSGLIDDNWDCYRTADGYMAIVRYADS